MIVIALLSDQYSIDRRRLGSMYRTGSCKDRSDHSSMLASRHFHVQELRCVHCSLNVHRRFALSMSYDSSLDFVSFISDMNTPDLPFRVSDVAANTSQSLPKASVLKESVKHDAPLDLLIDTNRVNGNQVSMCDMRNL
jgi:hypothetical protein